MAKQIVHLETKVNTVFGLLDEDGNVIRKFNVNATPGDALDISILHEEAFTNAFFNLYQLREKLIGELKQAEELEERQKVAAEAKKAEEEVDINLES